MSSVCIVLVFIQYAFLCLVQMLAREWIFNWLIELCLTAAVAQKYDFVFLLPTLNTDSRDILRVS